MVLVGDNVPMLAEYLDQSEANVYHKLSCKISWALKDVCLIRKRYNLTNNEVVEIFIEGCDVDAKTYCEGSCK
jgi:hypothetical protein